MCRCVSRQVWEEVWDLPDTAYLSSWLLLLITAGAVVCSAFFERRLWCRWARSTRPAGRDSPGTCSCSTYLQDSIRRATCVAEDCVH